jgi:hypothetical protein
MVSISHYTVFIHCKKYTIIVTKILYLQTLTLNRVAIQINIAVG